MVCTCSKNRIIPANWVMFTVYLRPGTGLTKKSEGTG